MKSLLTSCMVLILISSCANEPKNSENPPAGPKSVSVSCAPTLIGEYLTDKAPPLFEGLDYFDFPITTSSKSAQQYFNQGWALAAGFNHAEAARSFYWATRLDPDCAMCYWGLAYVLGPNYNAGMDPEVVSDAVESMKASQLLSSSCTERERDLIEAMARRYPVKHEGDRSEYDIAYSDHLGSLHKKYPDDNDIAALYAESIMDVHPWDLWDEEGEPKEWTVEVLDVLGNVRKNDPDHAIANHFYIHAVEASFQPELGNEAAERLYDIAPGAGHLVHMPSHIYIRTGEYHKCVEGNIKAVAVDSAYVSACHAAGAYPLAYYPHNFHFLCACAALEGSGQLAYEAAIRMQEKLDTEIMRQDGWGTVQHYYTIPYYIAVKFELWQTILETEMPDDELVYPRAILSYARGMAYVNTNNIDHAKGELEVLEALALKESLKKINVWEINDATDLVDIARHVLAGEIAAAEGNVDEAENTLKKAIAIEDGLNYNEPPDWFFSVRHQLGQVYLDASRYKDAESTYREDLFKYPQNGWSLYGLNKALEGQGQVAEAQKVLDEFNEAWRYADVELRGSRLN